jgi:ketosteroid isomerase-like protein
VAVEDWLEAGEDWRVAMEDVAPAGEHQVLAFLRVSIRGKGSGVPIEQRLYTLVTMRGTKVLRIADFTDRALALEAAGLTE